MCPPRPMSMQPDLFHPPRNNDLPVTPPWQSLPQRARQQTTSLLARLFLEHSRIRTDKADVPSFPVHRGEERDDV